MASALTIGVCKDCTDRYPACWGSCPTYLEAREELERKKQVRRDIRAAETAVNETQFHAVIKHKRRSQR